MAEKEVRIYRIEYDMENSTWQAYIAAFGQDEAVRQLYRFVPDKRDIKRITGTYQQCRLDAITDEVRADIEFNLRKKIKNLSKEIDTLKKAKDLRTIPKK